MTLLSNPSRSRWLLLVVYVGLLVGAVFLFLVIRGIGEQAFSGTRLSAPSPILPVAHNQVLLHVLATLAAVILLGRFLAFVLKPLGQPAVVGEIVAGILLGPSLLGAWSPDTMHLLIPDATADPQRLTLTALGTVSQMGIVFYMFIVGLELNTSLLAKSAHAAIAISHASIVIPFLSGAALALWLFTPYAPSGVPFTSFALFMGIAMSITAFPVLARILTDRRLDSTPLGQIALGCAASDDVTAWCLLAVVIGIAQANLTGAFWTLVWTLIYLGVMLLIVRPLAVRSLLTSEAGVSASRIAGLFALVLTSALMTELIGIHAIFGAFLMGVIIPCSSPIAIAVKSKLYDVVTLLFLPAFFAITGMNTQIGLISGWDHWLVCGVILLVATAGKFGGTFIAARLTGVDNRMSAALGVLMNTRGLMELIVLNIGLSLGVISPSLYAMMVLMALCTTMLTGPVISWIWPTAQQNQDSVPVTG